MAYKGRFKPKNPDKYKGDYRNIIYRSSWEFLLMRKFDEHPDILKWSSEEHIIPYRDPISGNRRRYFPDFVIEKYNKYRGRKETVMIEVKPKHQTVEPKPQKQRTKRYVNEVYTWGTNKAKWMAAEEYCKDRGWKFIIMTEEEIGIK